jgi:hypothetical protein
MEQQLPNRRPATKKLRFPGMDLISPNGGDSGDSSMNWFFGLAVVFTIAYAIYEFRDKDKAIKTEQALLTMDWNAKVLKKYYKFNDTTKPTIEILQKTGEKLEVNLQKDKSDLFLYISPYDTLTKAAGSTKVQLKNTLKKHTIDLKF